MRSATSSSQQDVGCSSLKRNSYGLHHCPTAQAPRDTHARYHNSPPRPRAPAEAFRRERTPRRPEERPSIQRPARWCPRARGRAAARLHTPRPTLEVGLSPRVAAGEECRDGLSPARRCRPPTSSQSHRFSCEGLRRSHNRRHPPPRSCRLICEPRPVAAHLCQTPINKSDFHEGP